MDTVISLLQFCKFPPDYHPLVTGTHLLRGKEGIQQQFCIFFIIRLVFVTNSSRDVESNLTYVQIYFSVEPIFFRNIGMPRL
jgi:hypothetical protein